jgi:hypothetical protein
MSTPTVVETVANQPLWAIAEEYKQLALEIVEAAEQNDGVIPDEINEKFDAIEGTLTDKLLGCRQVTVGMRELEKKIKDEISILKQYLEEVTAQRRRFDDYVITHMGDVTKVEGPRGKMWSQNSNPGCEITDEDKVPDRYKTVTLKVPAADYERLMTFLASHGGFEGSRKWKAEVEVQKSQITAAWKATGGVLEVPGAEVKQKKHLRVNTKKRPKDLLNGQEEE